MKLKFIILSLVFLLTITIPTFKFQSNIESGTQTQTISLWFYERGFKEEFLLEKIKNFNESQSDISVLVNFISSESFLNQYLLDQASGTGPDLIHVNSDWLALLAEKNSILPLDEIIVDQDKYLSSVLRSVKSYTPSGEI
ncbi:MAG: extracellular solute-binding protein, partial [Candidatus Kariarchaeaceae archaeon]